ncbi:hypothetical protein [Azospirillum canadense]|uniref:hypothetical protein n=1 Tax=Azospirillum canadense TaxID=403962 RepID=UPI002227D2E7|nr:hypothetical protein [Azospirillum canadense]MCW2241793.1 hypothetical protein [Azospirillum canadense]
MVFNAAPGDVGAMNRFVEVGAEQLRKDYLAHGAELPLWALARRASDSVSILYGEFRVGDGASRENSALAFFPARPGLVVAVTLAVRGSDLATEDRHKVAQILGRELDRSP